MIEVLRVRDFALVEELSLELSGGFSVLTGETGAGKSILLQALGLLLGERANRDVIRAGASQARVEGLFWPGEKFHELRSILEEAGAEWAEGEPLLLARTVGADGRSRAHVNGALVPLAHLERIGGLLVEVSSQHQHQALLREETHLALLDAALDPPGARALAEYASTYETWSQADAEVKRLEARGSEAAERADFLRFQVNEIRSASLGPGEDEALRAEREVLLHAGKLLDAYAAAEAEIYSGPEAALDRVVRAARSVEAALRRDPQAEPIVDLLGQARGALDEAARELRARQAALEADPNRLEAVEDRLEIIRKLERKHGSGLEVVLARLVAMERELWEIENTETAVEAARAARDRAAGELAIRVDRLRVARQKAGRSLEERVGEELAALALGRASFRVEVSPAEPGPRGAEAVRFLLAPNPGEPPRPLARIASGGELSRILLGLKNALRGSGVETVIFDEVDAGIGGVTADAVGERLAALSRSCQVVCITHLPQIASRASHHFRVEKESTAGRTVTRVCPLDHSGRIEELARMLAGRRVTEATRAHANELLERDVP